MTVLSEWGQQYERMLRSRGTFAAYCAGRHGYDPEFGLDALIHFFQDAYHLKDWIKADVDNPNLGANRQSVNVPPQAGSTVEALFGGATGTTVMKLCADVANGCKHMRLDPKRGRGPRTGDPNTTVSYPATSVNAQTAGSNRAPEPATYDWFIVSDGKPVSAMQVANDVIVEWQAWLVRHGMLSEGRAASQ